MKSRTRAARVTRRRPLRSFAAAQRGQASTEYLVVAAAMALALFVPFHGNQSAAQLLGTAIRDFFLNLSFMISVL